jgi:shikimate dehydrogenase
VKISVLLGFPLAHSVTPAMYGQAFAAMGIDARCEKWVTAPEGLHAAVAKLRSSEILGANVTVPHKEAVIPMLDELGESARQVGAVNCILHAADERLAGHNTDKYGFMRSLREAGFEPAGKRVLVLGAGGAARAAAVGLLEAGVEALTIANRHEGRARALVAGLQGKLATVAPWRGPEFEAACEAADLIVNTTPLGTAHTGSADESPLDAAQFRAGVVAFDMVYNPQVTPFLAMAAAAGATAISGLDMLVYQGAESIRLFTGREAPVEVMRKAALAALHG